MTTKPPGFATWPKDLQRHWLHNQEVTQQAAARVEAARAIHAQPKQEPQRAEPEQEEQDDSPQEPMENDEPVYIQYRAKKITGAKEHPDAIVETGSLGSVEPPNPTYDHHLQDIVDAGLISDAQLETVVYANMRFCTEIAPGVKSGFFLGDGAGVGKGRQIAALILEHWRAGRTKRVLWVSVSNDLRYDAVRDLQDIKASHIHVFPREKDAMPKGKLAKLAPTGVIFVTYSLLISGSKTSNQHAIQANNDSHDLDLAHYPHGSRLRQIVDWLKHGQQDTLVVFDESHKAKNLQVEKGGGRSKTAEAVLRLQNALPEAHVVYSSATGASTPSNLAYMVRLGMAGFKNMDELICDLKKSGLGALELYSMALKATGSYVSRTLSYNGAEFSLVNVRIDPVFRVMYDRAARFVALLFKILDATKPKRSARAQFWGAIQRFFRQLLIASKVPTTAKIALQHVEEGMCVVIGLQSTGEANSEAAREAHGSTADDLISAPRIALQQFIERQFPATSKDLEPSELSTLEYQVRQIAAAWRQEENAKATAASGVHGPQRAVATRMRTTVRMDQESRGAGSSAPGMLALPSATASAASDDEEPMLIEEKSLDQVLEDRRQQAVRAGQFLDLTEAVTEADKAAMEREVKAEEAQETAAVMQKEADNLVRERQAELEEALEDLRAAQAAIEQAWACKDARALERMRRLAESETATYEKAAVPSREPSPDENPTGRRRRRAAPTNLAELDPSPRPLQKRKGSSMAEDLMDVSTEGCDSDDGDGHVKAEALSAAEPLQAEPIVLEDDTPCQKCGSTDGADSMLLCDGPGCNQGCHMGCLDPPLTDIPEGDWICPGCQPPVMDNADGIPARARSRKTSMPGRARLCKSPPAEPDSPGAENRDPAAPDNKAAAAKQQQQDDKLANDTKTTVAVLERHLKAISTAVDARRAAVTRAERRAADPGNPATADEEQAFEPSSRAQRRAARAGGSAAKPHHSGRHIDLSDTEVDAVAAFPTFRHAVKSRHRDGGSADEESEVDDDDAGIYGYGFEDEEGGRDMPRPELKRIKKLLLRILDSLELPPNPLDQLVELMGGEDMVAEMTGRKGGFVRQEDNTVQYQTRRSEESRNMVNIKEKESFMRGDKLIAIISEAASVGISLQADRRVANQRRRCHLTLELPWSADKAIQQFGRSHRSNQASAPLYRILVTTCGGEHRFASSAAKRLQSLGALLKGDRRALGAGADLKEFDIDNKYGIAAVKHCLQDIIGETSVMPGVQVPSLPAHLHDPNGGSADLQFFNYMQISLSGVGLLNRKMRRGVLDYYIEPKAMEKVSMFLNRLMVMPTYDQELLFSFFMSTLDAVIQVAMSKRQYDTGIQNMNASYTGVRVISREIIFTEPTTGGHAFATHLAADRGLSWEGALARLHEEAERLRGLGKDISVSSSGFWIGSNTDNQGQTGHPYVSLAVEVKKAERHATRQLWVFRPNNHIGSMFTEAGHKEHHRKVSEAQAKRHWIFWHSYLEKGCMHGKVCSRKQRGDSCFYGSRIVPAFVISGAVLPLLSRVYGIVERSCHGRPAGDKKKPPPRVIKVTLDTAEVIVGMSIVKEDLQLVKDDLLKHPVAGTVAPVS
ncbi:hypothetical protein WJX84_010635 [Apatococcus fuscideae]|uniref:PHD-type domain-containing protein n=1 Tax=Apatococcus fuscideae TaxID=2026836 RepID=A0AAW1T201_9CHLO